jgi:antirestriction protein ArdC
MSMTARPTPATHSTFVPSAPPRGDLYATVTAKIIDAIETGQATHTFPWHTVPGLPQNFISHRPYRGINTLLLWLTGHAQGYPTPYWATFNQWRERGHPVRKGERATTVVFWKTRTGDPQSNPSPTTDTDDATAGRGRFIARAYSVFNAAQVQDFDPPDTPVLPETARDAAAESFFTNLPLTVHHEGDQAFYRPATDTVQLPPFARFKDANAYYATRGHESVHATGAPQRLDRNLTGRFGTDAYAVEELIAELGAAFLCADLQLAPEPRPNHAGYIASWLKVLRGDTRAIFTAAGQAQAAVDWLHAQQPEPPEDLDTDADQAAPSLAGVAP